VGTTSVVSTTVGTGVHHLGGTLEARSIQFADVSPAILPELSQLKLCDPKVGLQGLSPKSAAGISPSEFVPEGRKKGLKKRKKSA
jgi:hypothetical protein